MQNADYMPAVALVMSQHTLVRYQEEDYVYRYGLYYRQDSEWLESEVQKLLDTYGYSFNSSNTTAVVRMVRNAVYQAGGVQPPFWLASRTRADVIVMANGLLHIADDGTVSLGPHNPGLFGVCGVPYDYDPTAKCPKWCEQLLWMLNGRVDEVKLLRQYCAWVFVSYRLKLERILWVHGWRGNNGKSTFMTVVRHVFGEAATAAVGLEAFTATGDFRLWPTLHKLANFSMDVEVQKIKSVASLNSYISGDPITINRKMLQQVTVEPTTCLFAASNAPPTVHDPTGAWWRRLLSIECELSPADVNPDLPNELRAEAPGILNWIFESLPDLLANKAFDIPHSVRERVAWARSQVNAARQFIDEKIEKSTDSDAFLTRDQVMSLFGNWCEVNGYRTETLQIVKGEMEHMCQATYHRRRVVGGDRAYGWSGVKWKPEEEGRAVSFQRNTDQGERLKEQENQNVRVMGQYNDVVKQSAALVDVLAHRDAEKQRLQDEVVRLKQWLHEAKANQSESQMADRCRDMANEIARSNGVITRQQQRMANQQTKIRLLKGQLDRAREAKLKISHAAQACNTIDDEVDDDNVNPVELDALLKRLGERDDVDDDGEEVRPNATEGVQGLHAGFETARGDLVEKRKDGPADDGAGGFAGDGGDAASGPAVAVE